MQFSFLPKRLNSQISEDRAIFLICMGIALVFWIMVKLSNNYTSDKEVQFQFVLPDDKIFSVLPPDKYIVQISGTGWQLLYEYFSQAKIKLVYDLGKETINELNRTRLRNDIINQFAARGVRIAEFNYDGFSLKLENKIFKSVPVRLVADISYAPQYHLVDSITLQPATIQVSGPLSKVNNIFYWETDSLVLNNLGTSVRKLVRLKQPDREIQLSQRSVNVQVPVEQYTEKSLFVSVQIKNGLDSLKIFPDKIMLTCIVGLSKYDLLSKDDFVMEVDLKNVLSDEDQNTVPIVLSHYPPYVRNVIYSPKAAEFFILKKTE